MLRRSHLSVPALAGVSFLLSGAVWCAGVSVSVSVDKTRVGMGRTVKLDAMAKLPSGKPAVGYELLPYMNGRRWGAHQSTDGSGRTQFLLPMPTVGVQELQVQAAGPRSEAADRWIWFTRVEDHQKVYLCKTFHLAAKPTRADLWFAVDDSGTVYLNGKEAVTRPSWHDVRAIPVANLLHAGENTVCIEANNGAGPAGVLARIEVGGDVIVTDGSWRTFDSEPSGWPSGPTGGVAATELAKPGESVWQIDDWPTERARAVYKTGTLLPAGAIVSNVVQVRVDRRKLQVPPKDPERLIGVQWEPWFTPANISWGTAEAVPVMGYYSSFLPEITRQHVIWLAESGTDFLVTDWSNHIWTKPTWDERDPGSNELIHSTNLAMEVLAAMRDEGIPVPKMTLLTGVSYAPGGEAALNGMLNWIYQMYIRNPRFKDLWVELDGKPLILVLDLPAEYYKSNRKLDDRFTIRYNGANQERSHTDRFGFWSWMDGAEPTVTMVNGKAEALTACIGYFPTGGWKQPLAHGRRGGATLLEAWRSVLKYRPKFVQVHQFNEFAGQPEGQGTGPNHEIYVDTYDTELSDDFEPTSLTTPGYRGDGGWGFTYLNLMRALVDLYRQPTPYTTVLVVSSPSMRQIVKTDSVEVTWDAVGKPAAGYTVQVNGKTLLSGVKVTSAKVSLAGIPDGPVTIRVTAEGTKSKYILSATEDSLPLAKPVPAYAEVTIRLKRG